MCGRCAGPFSHWGNLHWCVYRALSVAMGSVFQLDSTHPIQPSSTLSLASLPLITSFKTSAALGIEGPMVQIPHPETGKALRHMLFLLYGILLISLLAHPSRLTYISPSGWYHHVLLIVRILHICSNSLNFMDHHCLIPVPTRLYEVLFCSLCFS